MSPVLRGRGRGQTTVLIQAQACAHVIVEAGWQANERHGSTSNGYPAKRGSARRFGELDSTAGEHGPEAFKCRGGRWTTKGARVQGSWEVGSSGLIFR